MFWYNMTFQNTYTGLYINANHRILLYLSQKQFRNKIIPGNKRLKFKFK